MLRFGIEYTFLTPDYCDDYGISSYVNKFKQNGYKRAHEDAVRVVEVPSPVFKTLKQAKRYQTRLYKIAKKLGCTLRERIETETTIQDEMTGCGHVHIEFPTFETPELEKKFFFNLIKFQSHFPQLNWIFNQWMDDINANALASDETCRVLMRLNEYDLLLKQLRFSKKFGISIRENTLEFRMFNSPENWQDTRNHVDFAQAFIKYVADRTKEGSHEFYSSTYICIEKNKDNKEHQWRRFNALLYKIGLNDRRYAKYKKNLDERFMWGTLK